MHNFEHKKQIEMISKLDEEPADAESFSERINAEAHLEFLRGYARTNDVLFAPSYRAPTPFRPISGGLS